jgi:hypothetical protein
MGGGRALPALLRKVPEPVLERYVLPRLLSLPLLVDPMAATVFRDVLSPRPAGDGPSVGLLSLPAYRRSVLPFFMDALAQRKRAVRAALLVNLPRAAAALPPDARRRTIFPEVRAGPYAFHRPCKGACTHTHTHTHTYIHTHAYIHPFCTWLILSFLRFMLRV